MGGAYNLKHLILAASMCGIFCFLRTCKQGKHSADEDAFRATSDKLKRANAARGGPVTCNLKDL